MGHRVELFDLRESLGGVAASAIPSGRLTREGFENEAAAILDGFKEQYAFHGREGLSDGRTLDWFAAQFDAVFLAIGLGGSTALSGERPEGVEDAIGFLERAKRDGVEVPERVAVLGGGNTAMDAATTAISCGARDVYIVYRRSFAEMPAWPAERDEALEMGVHFLLLTQPVRYVADERGRLAGLVIARTVLGEPDSSGRRRPIGVPDSESVLEVEMALEALGQKLPDGFERLLPGVELTTERLIETDDEGTTSRDGVFAGGDVTNGGATVVQAVADGMCAAEAIDGYLRGTETA
jgi:NADPH-dependent glutamate synthase beta subunit-like oxidoreductase